MLIWKRMAGMRGRTNLVWSWVSPSRAHARRPSLEAAKDNDHWSACILARLPGDSRPRDSRIRLPIRGGQPSRERRQGFFDDDGLRKGGTSVLVARMTARMRGEWTTGCRVSRLWFQPLDASCNACLGVWESCFLSSRADVG